MQTPVRLAVDLGTTHTVAVVGRGDQEPRALLFDGSPLLPSGVFLDAEGALHTGRDAQRLAAAEPSRFEPHPKRRIDESAVLLGEQEMQVEDLLAAGLRRVAEEASASGLRPSEVALTYPADWGPVRRNLLERAADLSGLGAVRLIPEPVAAAAYCAEVMGREIPGGGTIAVFDFGGGTLDVAVLRREDDGRMRTLAVGGLDDLGGLDVDNALVAHLGRIVADRDTELWRRLSEPESAADRRYRLAFWGEVRAAKEMLSRTSTAPVALPGHNPMGLHLTRDELTSLADPLVARAVDETRRTIERAGVEPGELTSLLLVGGSSRMPLVATRLHARLGVAPTVPEQPELPVALGAIRHAEAVPEEPVTPQDTTPAAEVPVSPVTYVPLPPSPVTEPVTPRFQPQAAPRPPRRLSIAVPVISTIVMVIVVALAYAYSRMDFSGLGDGLTFDTVDLGPTEGPASVGDDVALELIHEQVLTTAGSSAVAASDSAVFLAEVVGGATLVYAVSPDGGTLWTAEYELEPQYLYLTVVGDLLIIDAESSATDEGRHMRAAVSIDDGALLWKAPWENMNDVAFFGTDVVAERRDGIYNNAVVRIDLATGEEVWSEAGPDGLYIIDEYRIRAATAWDEGDAGPGTVPPNSHALFDNLVAEERIVDLDPYGGTAVVRDAGTGDAVVSGELPVDSDHWTVFDGFVIGKLSDDASPGRDVLAAFALSDLSEAWRLELEASYGIEHVKACGPQLVCASIDHSDTELYKVIAMGTDSGDQAWEVPVEWSNHDNWYSAPSGLVIGDQPFDDVGDARVLDFDGRPVVEAESYHTALTIKDGLAVVESVDPDSAGSGFQVEVVDTGTGARTAASATGESPSVSASVWGGLLAVVASDGTARVYGVPELS